MEKMPARSDSMVETVARRAITWALGGPGGDHAAPIRYLVDPAGQRRLHRMLVDTTGRYLLVSCLGGELDVAATDHYLRLPLGGLFASRLHVL